MVRRIKEDLRVIQGGFPRREVKPVTLDAPASEPELELFRLLSEYQEAREAKLPQNRVSRLIICHLQQRLFSFADAFARTLKVHRRSVSKQQAKLDEKLLFRGLDAYDERASVTDEEIELERNTKGRRQLNSKRFWLRRRWPRRPAPTTCLRPHIAAKQLGPTLDGGH